MSREAEIRARVDAATPGPWRWLDDQQVCPVLIAGSRESWQPLVGGGFPGDGEAVIVRKDDARFIAHAREDVPYLLARVRELEAAFRDAIENIEGDRLRGTWKRDDPDALGRPYTVTAMALSVTVSSKVPSPPLAVEEPKP